MADDIKRGAARIITDLHTPLEKFDRPGVNNVSRGEVYREVRVLATADLSLARMLDEFDAKLRTMNDGLFDWHREVTDDFNALHSRISELEARTFAGRVSSFRATVDRLNARFEAAVFALVFALDNPGEPEPDGVQAPENFASDAEP